VIDEVFHVEQIC